MTDQRWVRVKALFQSAVERPLHERAAFLAATAGDDEDLRRQVESLLSSDISDESFLGGLLLGQEQPPSSRVALRSIDGATFRPGLTVGFHLGPYEVLAPIGAGGMGEVYRARDTKLNRNVALKVLPDSFAGDTSRLERFTREAQTLAALNHPNIAHLLGVEESGGIRALVMELVEGDDLSDRIARGALAQLDALLIARQIADALAAAHEQGIVHRDLKPANIRIRADGAVKVLDFGLARTVGLTSSVPVSAVPALLTGDGLILGTAAYMSPEQAKGLATDRRSDVWAFGVVLYEMLTGRCPFVGDAVTDTLAAVLSQEPDWTALPPATPSPVRRLLRRCLVKDRTRRLADLSDARLDIDDAVQPPEADGVDETPRPWTRERLAWSVLLLVAVAAAALAGSGTRSASRPAETTRALLAVAPVDQSLAAPSLEHGGNGSRPTRTAVALSPDGKTLVFGAIWGGDRQLYARALDRLDATPLPGTAAGGSPFFSPDGEWLGFWAAGELRKMRLSGGPAVMLCKAAALFGATWGSDGTIVFATARNGGLWKVSAEGGRPEALTTLKPGEYSHRLPHMMPGGDAVIFTISKGAQRWDDTEIVVRSLTSGEQTVLVTGGADGRYVSTGHLVYIRLGTLMAVPFDPVRLAVTGGATGLIDDVMQAANRNHNDMQNTLAGQFTTSDTGALVYVTGGSVAAAERALAWVDRRGVTQTLPAPARPYFVPRLSHDGQHVAVSTRDLRQLWSYDIPRHVLSPVTVDGQSTYGIIAPDGSRVVFRSGVAGGEDNLYWKAADGSGPAERLLTSARSQTPGSWSPDGKSLAFVEEGQSEGFFQFDIWVLSLADRTTRPVVRTTANETSPEFSPDGHWLAYASNETGRSEVYVQPYPGPGRRHLISTGGGEQPAWGRNGRELFYVEGPMPGSQLMRLMSVSIVTGPAFVAGPPERVFDSADLASNWGRSYDIAPDGRRFLIALDNTPPAVQPPVQLILVTDWFEELKRLVPAK